MPQKDDTYIAALTREKYELWGAPEENELPAVDLTFAEGDTAAAPAPAAGTVVAEGDSWFDYPIGRDVLHWLRKRFKYRIAKVAQHGDTLENMVYGTEIDPHNFRRKPASWWETKAELERHQPNIFLFSAGGNDFAGPELEGLLNHASSALPPIRDPAVQYLFGTSAKNAYEDLFSRVWQASPQTNIIIHGYGYAIPDGRSAKMLANLIKVAGPWLRPAMAKKGITDPPVAQGVMNDIVDAFNAMLEGLANTYPQVHYLDLRPVILPGDWENELHLDDDGFEKVAVVFDNQIQALGGP